MEDSQDQMHSLLTPGSATGSESVALPSNAGTVQRNAISARDLRQVV